MMHGCMSTCNVASYVETHVPTYTCELAMWRWSNGQVLVMYKASQIESVHVMRFPLLIHAGTYIAKAGADWFLVAVPRLVFGSRTRWIGF